MPAQFADSKPKDLDTCEVVRTTEHLDERCTHNRANQTSSYQSNVETRKKLVSLDTLLLPRTFSCGFQRSRALILRIDIVAYVDCVDVVDGFSPALSLVVVKVCGIHDA